jgi:DNA polymerase-1
LEYFQGFLFHADKNDVIHTDFKPHGTKTGRFSSSDPNLQNLTKPDKYDTEGTKDDSLYPVRRAFVPRDGYFLAMLDYDQMEYRLFLDLCRAHGLIEKVKAGLDVHEATAEIGGVSRTEAKMCNFATLYGSGVKNLSEKLGCSEAHARKVRDSIFHSAPEIPEFIRRVIDMAEKRGYIFNWFGRRYQFPDRDWSYRAPNYLIQGGTADVNKIALNRLSDFLEGMRSRLILTIHDEAVFEIHEEEALLIPRLKEIMETVYPYKYLPLTCSVEYSFKSLADKTEGYPLASSYGEKAGNNIQGEGTREARSAP